MMKPSVYLRRQSNVMFLVANLVTFFMCVLASDRIFDNGFVALVTAILNIVFIVSLSGQSGVMWEQSKRMAEREV